MKAAPVFSSYNRQLSKPLPNRTLPAVTLKPALVLLLDVTLSSAIEPISPEVTSATLV